MPIESTPITSLAELIGYFEAGYKPPSALRIGIEHEKIGIFAATGQPIDYPAIRRLLEALMARGHRPIWEEGLPIALEREGGTLTLEPGGQVEHSGPPCSTAFAAAQENDSQLDELLPLAQGLGIQFLGIGFRPFGSLEEVPWMPKGRYQVMRAYLPTRGTLGHEMMKRTATVQANVDYTSEADAMEKLRLGLGLSSIVTALFAASPIVGGKPVGYQSYRASVWQDTDPDRCGLLPFAFTEGASFRDYVEWALDVPLFFLHREGSYRPLHVPFRQLLAGGVPGERATLADWALHLSTLFPEVRLKRYLEVRQADASSREMARALPALWQGILYDRAGREAAWALVKDQSMDERMQLYRVTPRQGLRARVRDTTLSALAGELVAIAKTTLLRIDDAESARLLEPLEEILQEGRSVADRMGAEYEEVGRDPVKWTEKLLLRA